MLGGAGNDYIQIVGPSTNIIDGGSGLDTLFFYRPDLTVPVTVNVVADGNGSTYAFSLPDGTTVSNVELLGYLATGNGNDQVTFANTTIQDIQTWDAGGGNDTAIVDFSAFSTNVTASYYYYYYYSAYLIGTQQTSYYYYPTYTYGVGLYGVENLTLYGGSGNDSLQGLGGNNTLIGNDGNDGLYGQGGDDYLSGGEGDDSLADNGGNNTLLGGAGNDTISISGSGTNLVDGGTGLDKLHYYRSDLTVPVTVNVVADGNGSTYAFSLPDGTTVSNVELLGYLATGNGNDQVTFANTTIQDIQTWDAGGGNDTAIVDFSAFSTNVTASYYYYYSAYLIGTQQTSYYYYPTYTYGVGLYGVENLTLYGGSGNDSLQGLGGNNTLIGGAGNDVLQGGLGNDYLSGGMDNDYLFGGAAADIFVYESGTDTVGDFTPGTDRIDLTGVAGIYSFDDVLQYASHGANGSTVIDFGNNNVLNLLNVQVATLTSTDFIYGPSFTGIGDGGENGGSDHIVSSQPGDAIVAGAAPPNSTVTLRYGGTILEGAQALAADENGNWSYTLTAADIATIGQGAGKFITVTATDSFGHTSAANTSFAFMIDTIAPSVSVTLADDTGAFSTDSITKNPTLAGSGDPDLVVHCIS